jgi:signal transduction histidine kinase
VLDAVSKFVEVILGLKSDDENHYDLDRGLAVGMIFAIPLCSLYAIFYGIIGFQNGFYVSVGLIPALLLTLVAIRARVPSFIVINLLNFIISFSLVAVSFYSGGVRSTAVQWLVAPVLFSFWAFGPALGFFWAVVGILLVSTMYMMTAFGYVIEHQIPEKYQVLAEMLGNTGYILFSAVMTWTFYWRLNHALGVRDGILRDRQAMVQTMAHDLKNPIAGIVSRIYLMERRRKIGEASDPDEIFDQIKKDSSKVLEHIDQLLLLNRSTMVRRVPVIQNCDVRSVFERAIKLHQEWMAAKSIQIDATQIIATTVKADPELLLRLFENILSNAIKYSHPQSYIRCAVRESKDSPHHIVIDVSDQGVGMDPREAEHFFKLKYRPNRPTAGESSSGVGAALMYEITQVMNGKIWLQSKGADQGTTVSVQFERGSSAA